MAMTFEDRLRRWRELKTAVANCQECIRRWPSVADPLTPAEIPDPEGEISVMFVGVAPPPLGSEDEAPGHFYSNPGDRLRLGLFRVLDRVYGLTLTAENRISRAAGTSAFLRAGFFFAHAAKVRPRPGRLAPERDVMRFCARQHLALELLLLQPRGVCFLGITNAAPAARSVFGTAIDEVATWREINARDGFEAWSGWVVSTVQPVRGTKQGPNEERTAAAIRNLQGKLDSQVRS